jgi:IS6 family transposase
VYLYRAVDSSGATIDFLLSAKRDAAAAERFLAKALRGENHPAPRIINTDEHAGYPPAIVRLKAEEALKENGRHRPVQYLKGRTQETEFYARQASILLGNNVCDSGHDRSPTVKGFFALSRGRSGI